MHLEERRKMGQKHSRSNEVKEGGGDGRGEEARKRVVEGIWNTDGAQQKVVDPTPVNWEPEDNVQPGPEQGSVGRGEETGEEDEVRNRGILGRNRQSEGDGAERS